MEIPSGSRQREVYRLFLDFVSRFNQTERSAAGRRIFGVFLWCFLIPMVVVAVVLLLVNLRVLPASFRSSVDAILLLFPVLYSLYYLSTHVFPGLRQVVRGGGVAANLHQARVDSEWRIEVCEAMGKELKLSESEWTWVASNFEVDLDRLQARNRYLTALAGAVFFMIMQGIDWITADPAPVRIQIVDPAQGILETVNPAASEWVGLALFLLLLFLSGSQAHQHLARYLPCVRWVRDRIYSSPGKR